MANDIGFLFPGQGSQFVGMGQALFDSQPDCRRLYEAASDLLGYDLPRLCFKGPADQLNLTEYTQPALLVTSLATFQLFQSSSLQPKAVAGHSLGEYSAIVAAGGLAFPDAVQLVQKRGQYMAESVSPGSGLVVAVLGGSEADVRQVCLEASTAGLVAPANFNAPGQIVVAGEKAGVERAMELLKSRGVRRMVPLAVSVPVHTPLMRQAAERLKNDLDSVIWSDLTIPVVNNWQAARLSRAAEIRASLVQQLPSPVLWEQSIQTMAELGINRFIEIGPGKVLTGLVKRILPKAETFNVHDVESFETVQRALES